MARLFRPHIPLEVRCIVACRQTGLDLVRLLAVSDGFGAVLKHVLPRLAKNLGCEASELRLDHDPPLGARPKHRHGLGKKTYYIPDANDPDHLRYRPHGPQHEGSHLIKTNVRGEHGQHPDRVLIKKQRRLERGPKPRRGPKIQSRGFEGKSRPFPKRSKR